MKNIISETKNSVNGLNNRIEGPKERNSELENRITETTQSEKQKENTLEKKMNGATETCGLFKKKKTNIHVNGVSQEKKGVELRKN